MPGFGTRNTYIRPPAWEAGFTVDAATKDKESVKGKYGITAKPTIDVKDLKESNYDLVKNLGGQ